MVWCGGVWYGNGIGMMWYGYGKVRRTSTVSQNLSLHTYLLVEYIITHFLDMARQMGWVYWFEGLHTHIRHIHIQ